MPQKAGGKNQAAPQAQAIPASLLRAMKPVTILAGHYGAGKTNLAVNLAVDAAESGATSLIDLDIVNPYFRATEQRRVLEEHGVNLVAPVFAEAGSSLDVPSLTGQVVPTLQQAGEGRQTFVDAGGDDAGATALGRFSGVISACGFAMLYVANRYRNLVQDPADALQNLREIEQACKLRFTGIVGNSHLGEDTDAKAIDEGMDYVNELSALSGLPVAAVTVPESFADSIGSESVYYRVKRYVRAPWE